MPAPSPPKAWSSIEPLWATGFLGAGLLLIGLVSLPVSISFCTGRLVQAAAQGDLEVPLPPWRAHEVRSIGGAGNHPERAELGAVGSPYRRLMSGRERAALPEDLPSPREVSNRLHAAPEPFASIEDPSGASLLFAAFGQFLAHDITLRAKGKRPRFIRTGTSDPKFPPGTLIPYAPNAPHPKTGDPYNQVTAWLDGSVIYGSDPGRARALRSFEGGRLRTSPEGQLPIFGRDEQAGLCRSPGAMGGERGSLATLPNENPRHEAPTSLFVAGDVRANENPLLLSLHTIFLREHNRFVSSLAEHRPSWSDERLYQEGRRWVSGLLQAITYEEYLPVLLGPDALASPRGYRPDRAAGLSLELVSAALRIGHSQMGPTLHRVGPDGGEFVRSHVSLKAAFFATPVYRQAGGGPASWLLGAARTPSRAIDLVVVDDLRNYMFGNLMGGLDIAAINVAVGRESLAGSFSDLRTAVGLDGISSFAELGADPETTNELQQLYGSIDRMDLWVGLLAEAPEPGRGLLGPTARAVLIEGFSRLRDGDRFFYAWDPGTRAYRDQLRRTTLSQVIRRNLMAPWSSATVPEDVFRARPDRRPHASSFVRFEARDQAAVPR